MVNFYIKSVTAVGKDRTPSVVEFVDGVNIIKGESDTGKTKVISSILFAMGSNQKPFSDKTGYDKVILKIGTSGGDISFSREYNANQIEVVSWNSDIESGKYSTRYNAAKPPVNDIWLHLMGIDEQPMLASNADAVKKRMTWNNLMRLFAIDEQEICRETSIIEPAQYVERTLMLSAILYLVYGKDFAGDHVRIDKAVRDAKRLIMEKYLKDRLSSTERQLDRLSAYAEKLTDFTLQEELNKTAQALKEIEDRLGDALESSQNLVERIMDTEKKLGEMKLLANRYDSLQSQYESDIRRLAYVSETAELLSGQKEVETCPYCDNRIVSKKIPSYKKTAEAEVIRIRQQISGLVKTQEGVESDRRKLEDELSDLQKQYEKIDALINEELNPRKTEIEKLLAEYQEKVEARSQRKVYEDMKREITEDLANYIIDEDEEKKPPEVYKPKDYFDADFVKKMDWYAMEILKRVNYPNLVEAHFDIKSFDLVINGGTKYDDHGKGYCAFINSVVTMMFRKFLVEHGAHAPGITIIDSPLHGMYQDVEDDAPESMKTGLFRYFCDCGGEGQLIISENDEHVPEMDFEALGVKLIEFSKSDPSKRHGFLLDVYQ